MTQLRILQKRIKEFKVKLGNAYHVAVFLTQKRKGYLHRSKICLIDVILMIKMSMGALGGSCKCNY